MDQEVSLRTLLLALGRRWKLIAAITLIGVVGGVLAVLLWPPEYQATATVAVTRPRYILEFDTRVLSAAAVGTTNLPLGVISANAYTALARNNDLLESVREELGWTGSLGSLESSIRLKADSGVIQFTGKSGNPQTAARIADTWSRLYATQLNELFSSTAPKITALEDQIPEARSALVQAEKALSDFQAQSQITSLQRELEAAATALSDRLALADRLSLLATDARALQSRLQSPDAAPTTAAHQFQLLVMETLSVSPQFTLPLQVQFSVDSGALTAMPAAEMSRYLEAFAQSLDQRADEAEQEAEALPAQISGIQQQLEMQQNEYDRLSLDRDVAKATYESIARKLEEERLQAVLEEPEVQVVSKAAVPTQPSWPEPSLILTLALVIGLALGAALALLVEYVRAPE